MLQKKLSDHELKNAEIMTFKIIRGEYIESTLSSGKIYFGCADYYAYQESTGNKGQGDKDEGLYARVRKDNTSYIIEQERLYGVDLVKIENGEFLDLKLRSVINMPVYCFYSINTSDSSVQYFDEPGETPKIRYRTFKFTVPKEVFKDFSTENFGIMNFINHTDLYLRIKKSLKSEGCEHLIKTRMKYVNRENKEWYCSESHPAELFYKDSSFSYQKEARIVVTDDKVSFINEKNISKKYRAINIGSVVDIVERNAIKIGDIRVEIIRQRIVEV